MPSLLATVGKYISRQVIALEKGIAPKDLRAMAEGRASRETAKAVNAKLRELRDSGIYKQSRARGQKTTTKNIFDLPVVKARITRERHQREKRAVSDNAKKTGLGKETVQAALEGAQASHDKVQAAILAYQAAKEAAQRDYASKARKGESRADYIKRATRKEYKVLSEALGDERKLEKSKPWKKLRSANLLDYDIDDIDSFYSD